MQVKYLECIVAQSRNEQALALNVGAHMVDAPFDAWQGNLLNEPERLSGSDCDWEREGPNKKSKGCRFHTHLW
jgi:hypothetical protein